MHTETELAEHFDGVRGHLRGVAYRMLGSVDEADDAVQETWLRASRAGSDAVANVTGWLTTIVGRVCLDLLRARKRRPEDLQEAVAADRVTGPEDEALLADSVGLALLVVLDRLGPAERIAFVLHDLFAVPFEQIAEVVERSPMAAKQLASRARRRVNGTVTVPEPDLARQREVVEAFLAASRAGDLDGLIAVLDPDVVRRADRPFLRGARNVALETQGNAGGARSARLALVDGRPGVVVAPYGHLLLVIVLTIPGDRITEIDVITAPAQLADLDLAVLDPSEPPTEELSLPYR